MTDWTKVDDALPELYKDCWVTYEFDSGSRAVAESYLDKDGKWAFIRRKCHIKGGIAHRKVVAWMYKVKPEPYEEKEICEDECNG